MWNCTLVCPVRYIPRLRRNSQRSAKMKRTPRKSEAEVCLDTEVQKQTGAKISSPARRSFLGKLGAGAAATAAVSVIGSAPSALASINPVKSAGVAKLTGSQANRVAAATALRIAQANADAAIGAAPHTTK